MQAFAAFAPKALLLTRVDEAVSLGGTLSALAATGLPVAYVSNGSRIPEDLAPARAHQLVARAVFLARSADTSRLTSWVPGWAAAALATESMNAGTRHDSWNRRVLLISGRPLLKNPVPAGEFPSCSGRAHQSHALPSADDRVDDSERRVQSDTTRRQPLAVA
jgi:hypothetical protein